CIDHRLRLSLAPYTTLFRSMCLFGERERISGARESFPWHESVEPGDGESKPRFARREVRRWGPRSSFSHFIRPGKFDPGARLRARSCGHLAPEIAPNLAICVSWTHRQILRSHVNF